MNSNSKIYTPSHSVLVDSDESTAGNFKPTLINISYGIDVSINKFARNITFDTRKPDLKQELTITYTDYLSNLSYVKIQ